MNLYQQNMTNLIFISPIVFVLASQFLVTAHQCGSSDYVYGQNEIVDQLLICSMGKSFDLDLKPHGEYYKKTAKTLIDQGLSNRTSIIHARLNGLWTAKRASYVESGWKCSDNATTLSSIIELNGLSLEVVEKVDIPIHRSQHKLALHKPCKTFDLPLMMCRQTKPIYRTTKTWVNRAYFNVTLNQQVDTKKPAIVKLSMIFTCPETFKQKITYSPSAMYIISKLAHIESPQDHTTKAGIRKRTVDKENKITSDKPSITRDGITLTHPVSYAKIQDGKSPASPPYHDSVNLIIKQVSDVLRSSLNDCINLLDSDLSLMADYSSFDQYKYKKIADDNDVGKENSGTQNRIENECSSKVWLKNRIELANQADANDNLSQDQGNNANPSKRSQFLLRYPNDPNELLNPYGYYHNNMDQMVDDN